MKAFFQRFSASGYICAHRGARSIAPENTMLACDRARLAGAALWETDVQISRDGELVLIHDDTLLRTTDVAACGRFHGRQPWMVADFSRAELGALDAGSWFLEQDPYATIAGGEVDSDLCDCIRGQKIPTLQEALAYCKRYDFPLNLEIKNLGQGPAAEALVTDVVALLAATATTDLVLISSFNHAYLRQIAQLNPAIALGALVAHEHPRQLLEYLKTLQVDAYHPDWQLCDAALLDRLQGAGYRSLLWTLNDVEQGRYFHDAGATFICTDWPQRFVAALRS